MAPFTLLVPIVGMASGVIVLGEHVHAIDIAGGVLILLGLALSVLRLKRRPAPIQGDA